MALRLGKRHDLFVKTELRSIAIDYMRNREWHRRNNWPSFAEQASILLFLLPANRRTSMILVTVSADGITLFC